MELLPWEEREKHGFFYALFLNVKLCLTEPKEYLKKIPLKQGYRNPIFFVWLITMLSTTIFLLIQMVFFEETLKEFLGQMMIREGILFDNIDEALRQTYLAIWLYLPALSIIGLFIVAWMTNLALSYLKKEQTSYEQTFRLLAYAHAVIVLYPIPFLGGLVAFGWFSYLVVTGLSEVYELPRNQAIIATFAPYALVLSLMILLSM